MPSVLLVGTPNSGKTALFNRLTGLNQRVANYPVLQSIFRSRAWRSCLKST